MNKILLIDDEINAADSLASWFSEIGYDVSVAYNGLTGIEKAKEFQPDIVISDIKMPDISGLEVLEEIKKYDPTIQIIMITAFDDMETTIMAMQKGAYDYISKPVDIKHIETIINRAIENKSLSQNLELSGTADINENEAGYTLIGKTPVMSEVFKKIGRASSTKVTVLIQGESGTGKELIARVIHSCGVTKDTPFVAINCTALPENLLESELFGHVKGAFTDAFRDKKGKFEIAQNGTIFLDEIADMSLNLQSKLLRVLQEHEFERVGGENMIPLKARIIAATNSNLQALVEKGKFREDLFYRLSVFTIHSPSLRERKDDIELLVKYFLKKINITLHKNVRKIPAEVMKMLINHEWRGNVRELENTLLQAIVLSKGDLLEKENILLRNYNSNEYEKFINEEFISLAELENKYISKILEKVNGNVKEACKILKISKATIYRKIEQYNIEKKYINEK